jgi:tRNA-dihydrouridine synthase
MNEQQSSSLSSSSSSSSNLIIPTQLSSNTTTSQQQQLPRQSKMILAPMVRAGHLPLRLLTLYHGAHEVFSEELIALKLRTTKRIENHDLGTIDFIAENSGHQSLIYRTCALEQGKNVIQLGAAGVTEAIQAAQIVAGDVMGIDLNMGCPEKFSTIGGMGSALLKTPQIACDIIHALRQNLPSSIRVSCKIRLLDNEKDTIALMQSLERAGAERITIHARRVSERPRDPARWNDLPLLFSSVQIPVVVNGDFFSYDDTIKVCNEWNSNNTSIHFSSQNLNGFMSARGAIADPAAPFSNFYYENVNHVMDAYLSISSLCDNSFAIDKWFATQVIRYREREPGEKDRSMKLAQSKNMEQLLTAFQLPLRLTRKEYWVPDVKDKNTVENWSMAVENVLKPVWERNPLKKQVDVSNDSMLTATTTTSSSPSKVTIPIRKRIRVVVDGGDGNNSKHDSSNSRDEMMG